MICVEEKSPAATGRSFEVVVTPCVVTRQFDRCIRVLLGRVVIDDEKEAAVVGTFSRDGLRQLLADLESVPDPVGLPSPEEVREGALYMWAAVLADGTSRQQYRLDGTETHFADLHLPDVDEFWIIPRSSPDALPWYGLLRTGGFVQRYGIDGELKSLALPAPHDERWEWHYYRVITMHFGVQAGQTEVLPPHIVHVLGWRIGETLFEIGIEEDGNFQVYRLQPKADARFAGFQQDALDLPAMTVRTRLELAA